MGLLIADDANDLTSLKKLFQGCATAANELLDPWGFKISFLEKSLQGISEIAKDNLFDGVRFPKEPGAFKRAAAVCLCARMFVDVKLEYAEGMEPFDDENEDAWRVRIAFLLIPMVIQRCIFTLEDGSTIRPCKVWKPASFHVRMEILGLLRWLETPIDASKALDADRLAKAILALALIIEQSYYLVDANLNCDVHDKAQCYDKDDPICAVDAIFLNPSTHQPYETPRAAPSDQPTGLG